MASALLFLAGVAIGWVAACALLADGFRDPDRLVLLNPNKKGPRS